jgi:gas vesicle protein
MDRDGLANFFLGLGVGVGLGLIFAPKTGEETREILKNKADEGREFLRKQDTLSDAIQAGKQAYRDKVDGDGAGQPV